MENGLDSGIDCSVPVSLLRFVCLVVQNMLTAIPRQPPQRLRLALD